MGFFKSVCQKNTQTINTEFKSNQKKYLLRVKTWSTFIVFYQSLYKHKDISEDALEEEFRDLPKSFIYTINESLSKEITEEKLECAVRRMA